MTLVNSSKIVVFCNCNCSGYVVFKSMEVPHSDVVISVFIFRERQKEGQTKLKRDEKGYRTGWIKNNKVIIEESKI